MGRTTQAHCSLWTRAWLALAATVLGAAQQQAHAAEAVDLELVLAADGSGSIDEEELRLQRAGYADALTDPRVLGAIGGGYHQRIAVAYVEWGGPGSQHTIVDWTVVEGEASARAFAAALETAPRQAIGYNSISGAIDYSADLIATNRFEGTRKVIDVSGDGPQIGGRSVQAARDDAVDAGITINALVVKSPGGSFRGPGGIPLDLHYERDVIGGGGAFVAVADETTSFAEAILNKLILEIAGKAPPGESGEAVTAAGVLAR
jgi:Protein of unknown function (DUF1194)